ncbi:MAG: hypothetical protein R3339_09505, partial [Thermodesulfobacteriota bacterium]|nr:hypothetical protein [Thermodesulfobacteriota bacterium]
PITPQPSITILSSPTIIKTKLPKAHRNSKRLLILISYFNFSGSKFPALFSWGVVGHITGKTKKVSCTGLDYFAEGKQEDFITPLLIFVTRTGKSRNTISNCTSRTGEKIILIANCHLNPPYALTWIIKAHIYQVLVRTPITLGITNCECYLTVITIRWNI